MTRDDLRNVEKERVERRRLFWALALTVAAIVVVAGVAALLTRAPDHHYLYSFEYGNSNGAPYLILAPMPVDYEWRQTCRFQGNGTMVGEPSEYGAVVQIRGTGIASIACRFDTWRDLAISLSTEGNSANGRPAARLFLDTNGFAVDSRAVLRISETETTWTTVRDGTGDVFEGWNTLELRQTQERTPSY